jgi:DNA (cytosine-5)-methyltransferase 1
VNVLSLFSGIGGIDLGLQRAGMTIKGQCEIDQFCRKVLEKHWPHVWRHNDVTTLTGATVRERCGEIELVAGGFPCQDLSTAGEGEGLDGQRSRLWWEMLRVVREVRPGWVLVENVPALRTRGGDRVLAGLAEAGYTARPLVVGAHHAGADHIRRRVWILANAQRFRQPRPGKYEPPRDTAANPFGEASGIVNAVREGTLPYVCRRHDGLSATVERNHALGNAVCVPLVEHIGRAIMRTATDAA